MTTTTAATIDAITTITTISKNESEECVVTFARLCIGSLLTEDDEIVMTVV